MGKATEVAVIDLTNTTDSPLKVSVVIDGVEHEIITLTKNESTTQVTPSGVVWKFGPVTTGTVNGGTNAPTTQQTRDSQEADDAPPDDGSKGPKMIH